jgi:hypothetical protein
MSYAGISSIHFFVKWVPGRGPEQRESVKTVLYLQIIIILISYIIIKLLINENHPCRNWKWNSHSFILNTNARITIRVIGFVIQLW